MFKRLGPAIDDAHYRSLMKSLESFDDNPSEQNEVQLLGAVENIGAHIEFRGRIFKDNFKNLASWMRGKGELGTVNQRIANILHEMLAKGRVLDEAELAKTTKTLLPYNRLLQDMEARHRLFEVSHSILALSAPTGEAAYHQWVEKFQKLVNSMEPVTGIACSAEGKTHHTQNYFPKATGTLQHLGYDRLDKFTKLHGLMKSAEHLWEDWRAMDDHMYSYGHGVHAEGDNKRWLTKAQDCVEVILTDWQWWDFRMETTYAVGAMRAVAMCTRKKK